jgi:phosphate acetyltransferase
MAACLAAVNGVRLAGLLLTAGIEPDPEVTRLTGAAAATGLSILVVDDLTYPTAVRLHTLHPGVPYNDSGRAHEVARTVADALDPAWIQTLPMPGRPRRVTPAAIRHHLVETARRADARVVLPEGAEPRTVQAAVRCAERGIARSLLLAAPDAIAATLRMLGPTLPAGGRCPRPGGSRRPLRRPAHRIACPQGHDRGDRAGAALRPDHARHDDARGR